MPVDQRTNDFVTQPFRCRIYRQHFAAEQRVSIGFKVGENDKFAGCHLTPVIESHRSGYQKRLSHNDRAIEKWLTGPHALEESALIPENRVKDPEASTGGENAFGDHAPHT